MTDLNRLLETVSCLAEGNLFAVYPRILASMLENSQGITRGPPDFEFLLPSNEAWRTKIYYQLVDKQRSLAGTSQAAALLERPRTAGPWDTTLPQPPTKKPRRCTEVSTSFSSRASVASSVAPVTWTVSDIAKASGLLGAKPWGVEFCDEYEMRRVYSLIYDVFRYKNILNQALIDVSFYALFPELEANNYTIWLLLYDLYHRRFDEREFSDGSAEIAAKLFPEYGLSTADAAVWTVRVRLAASLSRLRIANSALRLSDLLPIHLRDERVIKSVQVAPVTCWVNKNKFNEDKFPEEVFNEIKNELSLQGVPYGSSASVGPFTFRWDPLCPLFLCFHYTQRCTIAQSGLVSDNILVMQNRSFCLGPAVFCRLLLQHNLTGTVVQSHIHSPRATAYLATLLTENDQINNLYVFGAGAKKAEYDDYFAKLKIKNVTVYSQKLTDMEPDANILQQVVAVFATPPNSYSAVNDPIDLVCSRGGDLTMLEILTDTTESAQNQKRVATILEDQRKTLRFSMSRPQIQFVLYETHSQLKAENEDMVQQVIQEVNRAAQYRHAERLGKIPHAPPKTEQITNLTQIAELEVNNNEMELKLTDYSSSSLETETQVSVEALNKQEEIIKHIMVPPTDSFEQQKIPDLCFNADRCLRLSNEGCYLALIERKEIVRLDAKTMIKMAEARGLFGSNTPGPPPSTRQKVSKTAHRKKSSIKRKRGSFEVERIAAQTHASMMRSCCSRTEGGGQPMIRCCPRHAMIDDRPKISPARLWWSETCRYLTRLKKSLEKQKLVSSRKDQVEKEINNIDEVLRCVDKATNIPLFPRLRLTRSQQRAERELYPVHFKYVPEDDDISE